MKKSIKDMSVEEIMHKPQSSSQLASVFNVSDRTIKNHYEPLKRHELIETKTRKGVSLSVKGVKFVRWGLLGISEIVKKPFTKKEIGKEKLPISPIDSRPPSKKNEPSFPVEEELIEDPESEILQYIKQNPNDNAVVVDEKYDSSLIKKMITQGIKQINRHFLHTHNSRLKTLKRL